MQMKFMKAFNLVRVRYVFENCAKQLNKFDGYFLPPRNLMYERCVFFTCSQQEVMLLSYRKNLKTVSLVPRKDDLIKDRIVCGIQDVTLCQHLLKEHALSCKQLTGSSGSARLSSTEMLHIHNMVKRVMLLVNKKARISSERLDAGAQTNLIPWGMFERIKISHKHLLNSNVRLVNYLGEKVPFLGKCCLKCT
ncbi:hypothetical protein PR048_009592 [Dryococelus australis]|uniref:Uncharacterized protein n=1 Tax=Dryococelus australis TaxID=614101 RepID=A0ABQ9I0D9_9NEOP|nr:hypothetical protein PR048_009592 [Dryococelus australis]